jgi:glycosyltransferase involved in cell wall biosynthesis
MRANEWIDGIAIPRMRLAPDIGGAMMKSALVHYWITGQRGGENVLEAIAELLPDADLIAHVIKKDKLFGSLSGRRITETFISKLPFASSRYQMYLPLMPIALELLDVSEYDLIVSSEAGPAKWIIPSPDAFHVCYCHSPLRYIWDQQQIYMTQVPAVLRPFAEFYAHGLRHSDILSATRVDRFVANSNFVARRIQKYYRRDAEVIHPPVATESFLPAHELDDYYLIAGEIRQYKRVDVAVEACTALGRRLIVIGGGDTKHLRAVAGPNVTFLGRVSFEQFRETLARCRALIFPGVEDFGIVPVEAMACGRPVIAYGRGGALDTIVDGVTGILYNDPSVAGLMRAIEAFEATESAFEEGACIRQAKKFSRETFQLKFRELLSARECL